jgi:hypothetical protein
MACNEEGYRQRTASGILSPHRTAALLIIIIHTTMKRSRCSQQHENQIWLPKYSTDPRPTPPKTQFIQHGIFTLRRSGFYEGTRFGKSDRLRLRLLLNTVNPKEPEEPTDTGRGRQIAIFKTSQLSAHGPVAIAVN